MNETKANGYNNNHMNYNNSPAGYQYGNSHNQNNNGPVQTGPSVPPGSYSPYYNNYQPNHPTIKPITTRVVEKNLRFRRDYLLSLSGIVRIVLILMLFGGWTSAAGARKNAFFDFIGDYVASRLATIIIIVIANAVSIIIFVFFILSINNIGYFARVNFPFITLLLDALFFFPMIALGITCAVREADYQKRSDTQAGVNQGAFGAAAFFAFFSALLYVSLCAIEVVETMRRRAKKENPPK